MSKHSLRPAAAPRAGRTATAFWSLGDGRGALRDEVLAEAGPGEVRVRSCFSAISRGTESLVFRGEVPASEAERMRAPFQAGAFGGPVKYGYCNVGRVEQGPADWVGRMVFCLHPHQTEYVVPIAAAWRLPEHLPPARAVLAAQLETAVNALWDGPPRIGERIAVVGGGVIGLLVGWLAAGVAGCEVELIDPRPQRAPVAALFGLSHALPAAARPNVDRVFHASGDPAGLETALSIAGLEATIIELSWYGSRAVSLPLGGAFHARRLRIVGSQVSRLPPGQQARWSFARRFELVTRLLADARLDRLISGETPFAGLPALMARLAAGDPALDGALCERIRYD